MSYFRWRIGDWSCNLYWYLIIGEIRWWVDGGFVPIVWQHGPFTLNVRLLLVVVEYTYDLTCNCNASTLSSLDCTIDPLDRYARRVVLCTGRHMPASRRGQPSMLSRVRVHLQVLLTYKLVSYLNLALVFRDLFRSSNEALALPPECYQRPHVHGLIRAI